MKTKLTLLFTALTFTGVSYGGPSDSAAFAIRHAQESAARGQQQAAVAYSDRAAVNYVPSSSGKGVVASTASDGQVTTIALFKSSKKASSTGAACCAKKQ